MLEQSGERRKRGRRLRAAQRAHRRRSEGKPVEVEGTPVGREAGEPTHRGALVAGWVLV
jgi:hypothetical protein